MVTDLPARYNRGMERVVRIFNSHAEANAADREFYRRLTPQQRVDMLLELVAANLEETGQADVEFKRVYRIVRFDGQVVRSSDDGGNTQ